MASKKLGRGLNALLSSASPQIVAEPEIWNESITLIDPGALFPSRFQPREGFDDEKIGELAASIKENGLLQPIIARKQPEGYEIIAGERRWRAAQRLGLSEVPTIIRDVEDGKMLELALVENIQREDLNPIEQAQAYQELVGRLNLTQEEVAARVGKKRSTVANFLRLLDLPAEVKEYVSRGTISMGHARALLSLENKGDMLAFADRSIKEGLSVRALESLIAHRKKMENSAPAQPVKKAPYIIDIQDRLRKRLGTKVLVSDKNGRGQIVIEYYSTEEFERLLSLIES
jgi:ParB family chromosome partitioning protein